MEHVIDFILLPKADKHLDNELFQQLYTHLYL